MHGIWLFVGILKQLWLRLDDLDQEVVDVVFKVTDIGVLLGNLVRLIHDEFYEILPQQE